MADHHPVLSAPRRICKNQSDHLLDLSKYHYTATTILILILMLCVMCSSLVMANDDLFNQSSIDHNEHRSSRWVGTWSTSPMPPEPGFGITNPGFSNQTLRQIVRVSIGGRKLRVRFSNTFGVTPLTIGAASLALPDSGSAVIADSIRILSFSGKPTITIPPGARVLSDPVKLVVRPLSELAITVHLPDETGPATWHSSSFQTSYISTAGNYSDSVDIPVESTTMSWFFLTGIEVRAPRRDGAIVALGNSITDGTSSTPDTNSRWPDKLAERLTKLDRKKRKSSKRPHRRFAVLNEGIAGNRVLNDVISVNASARFDRDVLTQAGVTHVVLMEGINDIGIPELGFEQQEIEAADIIAGYRQLIERAHTRGLKIFGATLTPFEGAIYYTPAGEVKRQKVNAWIRSSREFDAVIDFDRALRDPQNPTRFLPEYNSGDNLHPSDAGYAAMANAIDLRLFR